MKHSVNDGRGLREVWLDGMLLQYVVECDDDAASALTNRYPFTAIDGVLVQEVWKGCTMVVRSIEDTKNSI